MMDFTTRRLLKNSPTSFDGLASISLNACPELEEAMNGERFEMTVPRGFV